jgi:integrase
MAKLPRLEHVKIVRSRGRVYYYFNTGQKAGGKPIYKRLPDIAAPNFWDSYAACKAGRTRRATSEYTVKAMADEYERSADFRNLADGSQRLYRINLDAITAILGNLHPDIVTSAHVRAILDNEPWGAGKQNTFVAVLGALYLWGRRSDRTTADPAKDVARARMGEHEPWPDDLLDAALACDDATIRLATHLLFFTGQRIGDACKMRWGDIRDGWIAVTQQKTRKALDIPLAAQLKAELDATPRKGLAILTQADGKPVQPQWLRLRMVAWAKANGARRVPHGLRKNAVNALLEAGCSVAEVSAITGQTYKMVEHYAARINRKRMAGAAIINLEQSRLRKTKWKTS